MDDRRGHHPPTHVLQFSGGKDSLAVLHLLREQWATLTVVWVNTGAAYPETLAYMDRWRMRLPHFVEIKTDQPTNLREKGWPFDVVPMRYTSEGIACGMSDGSLRMQPSFACCAENMWLPMHYAMKQMNVTRIYRGVRHDDQILPPIKSGHVEDGIEYVFPIYNWTRDRVFKYLRAINAEIPDNYAKGERTGRDCWDCTGYFFEDPTRVNNLPPAKREIVNARLARMRRACIEETGA